MLMSLALLMLVGRYIINAYIAARDADPAENGAANLGAITSDSTKTVYLD